MEEEGLQCFIVKCSYDKEWFQADAVVNFPKLFGKEYESTWFKGLELIYMLRGKHDITLSKEQHLEVEKATKSSIRQSLELEQRKRKEYRENKENLKSGDFYIQII